MFIIDKYLVLLPVRNTQLYYITAKISVVSWQSRTMPVLVLSLYFMPNHSNHNKLVRRGVWYVLANSILVVTLCPLKLVQTPVIARLVNVLLKFSLAVPFIVVAGDPTLSTL